ncbi:hypothetical protein LUV28_17785 [Streptomyces sp. 8ZJF_21]|nr:hypothetical protein [Streptomyces sp. 8ZJF_21]
MAVYYRRNLTMRQLAPLSCVSPTDSVCAGSSSGCDPSWPSSRCVGRPMPRNGCGSWTAP